MDSYRRGALMFDVIDRGPSDGEPVVLLHGFPQLNTSWEPAMDRLVAQGYRCLAPSQRGYSPGARPKRRRDYRTEELAADVVALMDAAGAARVHLVGHDWGATVAWAVAALRPERLATLTAMSVPHPAAFLKAIGTSRQGLASWYIYLFALPKIPELLLSWRGGRTMTWLLHDYAGQSLDAVQRDLAAMSEPGRFTVALNWYRALPLSDLRAVRTRIGVPTMLIWSDGDKALLEKAHLDTPRYLDGEFRYEVLTGASHWMVDECPDRIADLLLDWLAAHPLVTS